jgi:transposase
MLPNTAIQVLTGGRAFAHSEVSSAWGDVRHPALRADIRVISGIVHVLKSGGRWIDAPEVCGPHETLYNRFVRWAAKGVWMDIFRALASAGGPPAQC